MHPTTAVRACFLVSRALPLTRGARRVSFLCPGFAGRVVPAVGEAYRMRTMLSGLGLNTVRCCASSASGSVPPRPSSDAKPNGEYRTFDKHGRESRPDNQTESTRNSTDSSSVESRAADSAIAAGAVDADDAISAFDQFLEESGLLGDGDDDDRNMTKNERRALALERERQFKRDQYIRRLDILTALPDDLIVQQVADKCPGCGCELQSKGESLPGYLPEEIRLQRANEIVAAAKEKSEAQRAKQEGLAAKAQAIEKNADEEVDSETDEDSAEEIGFSEKVNPDEWEEIEDPSTSMEEDPTMPYGGLLSERDVLELRSILSEEGIDLDSDSGDGTPGSQGKSDPKATIVCQRCFRLNNYGLIDPELRVESPRKLLERPVVSQNVTDEDAVKPGKVNVKSSKPDPRKRVLTASTFRQNLERLRTKPAVIVYLVDVFDFHGTFLAGLRDLIGTRSPVIMAVNKVDLLPKDYKADRVERWVRHEARALGLDEVDSVHLISSTRGTGVKGLLAEALTLARQRHVDIYVVGAANVGKSSFINHIMSVRLNQKRRGAKPDRSEYKNQKKSNVFKLTTSVIPGTTLDVIRVPLDPSVSLYDTPGIIMPHQLTNSLDPKELRAVLPGKSVERISLRLGEGKSMFLGGLARIDVIEGRPFFFTAFVSSEVKVHPGRSEDADEFTRRHIGDVLAPPFESERYDALGEWSTKSFTAEGEGWKRACVDIVLSGLGWVSLTGAGSIRVRICAPRGVGVFTREALLPFEVKTSGVSKFTGSTSVNVREASKAARKRKSRRFANEDYYSF